jgi:cytochrome c-type biogenesis protein CcmH/NrfG
VVRITCCCCCCCCCSAAVQAYEKAVKLEPDDQVRLKGGVADLLN